ncbi:cytochrome D ubiquinol oxidase subunit I [Arachidicoccus ginsenosidimutans]|uniref:pyridoxal phosphate-dependent decarboxylase family protein n=1 Tax=Arachidicoccus sp. BS20 TaxID=1850526 RepID=UPI0007F0665C|nr:pyridoxal-dependent decarboxylase [Arachidicoccus sp. BS20]ANI90716.1 cytochrome D ubiquinol oxidase subunit I [Arachidicoccus sp. BS20]
MQYWKKLTHKQQDERISKALEQNFAFGENGTLGIPASKLDSKVFYDDAPFLKDAPLLRTYVQNPNHIGCHTLGESEPFFAGTQDIEREVIELLSVDMMHAQPHSCDGYIAGGGTEANLQAVWIYRNYFQKEIGAPAESIALLASEDTHYSVSKASNIFGIEFFQVKVDFNSRKILQDNLEAIIENAIEKGKKYFIIIANMATTMFGSVDDISVYEEAMKKYAVPFKLHVDGAFGGFIYPLSEPDNYLNFANPVVSSITLDAHKMLQAPYGTGIFLVRKGLIQHVYTEEAQYVNGMDITLSGSRSGANAIAVWMILQTYGYHGWLEKINTLLFRTDWCCKALDEKKIRYYRHPKMNIITIRAEDISREIAEKYYLVPDTHNGNMRWYKIVVMDHVDIDRLQQFVEEL